MEPLPQLQQGLEKLELSLSPEIQSKLINFLELLAKWNKAYNLTAITDLNAMVTQHLLDSLVAQPYLQGRKIIDVGTGAGLPGLPLALVNPEKEFTLLDSNGKKTRFLQQVIFELDIKNIFIVNQRVEIFRPKFCFDIILSRAFASLLIMIQKTKHLLCKDGIFLALKGFLNQEELRRVPSSFGIKDMRELNVPGLKASRHLIIIERKQSG